jgi:hypothetical protein
MVSGNVTVGGHPGRIHLENFPIPSDSFVTVWFDDGSVDVFKMEDVVVKEIGGAVA